MLSSLQEVLEQEAWCDGRSYPHVGVYTGQHRHRASPEASSERCDFLRFFLETVEGALGVVSGALAVRLGRIRAAFDVVAVAGPDVAFCVFAHVAAGVDPARLAEMEASDEIGTGRVWGGGWSTSARCVLLGAGCDGGSFSGWG